MHCSGSVRSVYNRFRSMPRHLKTGTELFDLDMSPRRGQHPASRSRKEHTIAETVSIVRTLPLHCNLLYSMEQCFIIPFLGIGNTNVNDSGRIKGTGTRALNDPQSRNVATILAVFRSIFSHPPSPPLSPLPKIPY